MLNYAGSNYEQESHIIHILGENSGQLIINIFVVIIYAYLELL
jgi:hypothetical protein